VAAAAVTAVAVVGVAAADDILKLFHLWAVTGKISKFSVEKLKFSTSTAGIKLNKSFRNKQFSFIPKKHSLCGFVSVLTQF